MTTATRTVEVLSRQEINTNIVYTLENDRQEKYCVTLRKNGTAGCMNANNEQCIGTWSGNTCYHILHCIDLEGMPYERVEIDEEAVTSVWIDEEYEQYKRDHNLHYTMTREQYVGEYDPCGMVV
jgi:hypothetical protein